MIHPGFLLVLLGAALLPLGRGRRLAALAAVTAGLGLAGLPTAPIPADRPDATGFVAVEAALLALGAALALLAAVAGIRDERSPSGVAGSAAAAGGVVGIGSAGFPLLAAVPISALLGALFTVAALAIGLVFGARLLARDRHAESEHTTSLAGLAGLGVGTLLAAAASGTGLVFVGAMVAASGGWIVRRAPSARPFPLAPLLTLLVLPAWWLMSTIAGPEGLVVSSLPDLPWSPAAERLLAPLLLVAAWATSGLWPLHRQEPAALTAPAGALLVARVVLPAFPDGVEHWRALAMPLVVIGLWHAVVTGRRAGAVSALGWVGLLSSQSSGLLAAGLLFIGGLGIELGERAPGTFGPGLLRLSGVMLAGAGAFLAISAGLHAEVVYTALAAAALIAAAGRDRPAHARIASVRSAAAPRL